MEQIEKDKSVEHLAGIVPVGGQPLNFKMPWHDSLMPIAPNYLAVERAVYQCVLAGCETIWIVGHSGMQPLIRKRVGDTIIDPVYLQYNNPLERKKEVSIYYVPIHPKDRSKRDCLGWSVLYAADSAYRISKFISKWIAPEKFFCSFPYGIVADDSLRKNRKLISSSRKVAFRFNNETVKNNLHLPFTFAADDFFRCRDIVKHKQAEEWGKTSARYYDLAAVFSGLDIEHASMIDLDWFYDISTWEQYVKYLSSDESKLFSPPITLFMGNKRKPFERKKNEQSNGENIQSTESSL